MLLNRLEYALMNNPVRTWSQRRIEGPYLRRLGGPAPGVALEIGAGRGVGVEVILNVFGARRVDAFDLDPRMIARARARLARHRDEVTLWTGDATSIPRPDATYDAVFDFGVLHHVPDWRRAVAEIARVLKPGGRLYAEEILRAAIIHPLVRRLLTHPQHDRFDLGDLLAALDAVGLRPVASASLAGAMAWVVAERAGATA